MSHIAAALAKSKGKDAPAPPSAELAPQLSVAAAPVPAAAQTVPKKKISPVAILAGVVVLALAGGAAWLFFGAKDEAPAAPAKPPASAAAPKPAAPAPAAPKPSPPSAPAPAVTTVAAPVPVAAVPDADAAAAQLHERVAKFSITARRVAEQRVMIDGKMYAAGARVGEGLTVQEVRDDRVVFRDDSGRTYEK